MDNKPMMKASYKHVQIVGSQHSGKELLAAMVVTSDFLNLSFAGIFPACESPGSPEQPLRYNAVD